MYFRIPLIVSVFAAILCSQDTDVAPPVIENFSFTPLSVDTRSASREITFTARVSDALAGVSGGNVHLVGPNNQWQTVFFTQTSGTSSLGDYTAVLPFPQYTASGSWEIYEVAFWDNVSNYAYVKGNVLRARGFPTVLNVVSNPDLAPPQIQSLSLSPAIANVSAADATLTLTMRLTDNLAGMGFEAIAPPAGCNCIFVAGLFVSPSGNQTYWLGNNQLSLLSGDRRDGVWQGTMVLPR